MRPRISIRGFVCPSVRPSVRRSVRPSVRRSCVFNKRGKWTFHKQRIVGLLAFLIFCPWGFWTFCLGMFVLWITYPFIFQRRELFKVFPGSVLFQESVMAFKMSDQICGWEFFVGKKSKLLRFFESRGRNPVFQFWLGTFWGSVRNFRVVWALGWNG